MENVGGTYSLRKVPEDTLSLQAMTVSGAEETTGADQRLRGQAQHDRDQTDTPILETPLDLGGDPPADDRPRRAQPRRRALRRRQQLRQRHSDWLKVRGFKPTQFLDGLPMAVGVCNNEAGNLEPGRVALLRGPASSVYGQTRPAACSTWSACVRTSPVTR